MKWGNNMSAAAITLGVGYLPSDTAQTKLLDVHLHPDQPTTPISLGERCGPQSVGASFSLLQATDLRWVDHLRACGCEWMIALASEERMRSRNFTPQEILERKPGYTAAPPAAPPPEPPSPVLEKIRRALAEQDFNEIEGLRDVLTPKLVEQVAADWHADLPWETKDAYAALLLDQVAECVRPLFQDALDSPTAESRAYAVCVLTQDFSRFEAMMTSGSVDDAKVDAAVQALRSVPGVSPG